METTWASLIKSIDDEEEYIWNFSEEIKDNWDALY